MMILDIFFFEEYITNSIKSDTSNINCYYILPSNNEHPPIKIINTPGFGDTRENFDFEILNKFKNFFDIENSIYLLSNFSLFLFTSIERFNFTLFNDFNLSNNFVKDSFPISKNSIEILFLFFEKKPELLNLKYQSSFLY